MPSGDSEEIAKIFQIHIYLYRADRMVAFNIQYRSDIFMFCSLDHFSWLSLFLSFLSQLGQNYLKQHKRYLLVRIQTHLLRTQFQVF